MAFSSLFFFSFQIQKPIQASPKQPQGSRLSKRPVVTQRAAAPSSTAESAASGTTKKSASAIAAAQKREAQRKQLIEMRRKNKLAMTSATTLAKEDNVEETVDTTEEHTDSKAFNSVYKLT